jgi:C-terminal processing protease CtpA/Prc
MQSVYTLSDGSSLHITDKLWLTPDKQSIQGKGLQPNLRVPVATGQTDPQLRAAERYLAQRIRY